MHITRYIVLSNINRFDNYYNSIKWNVNLTISMPVVNAIVVQSEWKLLDRWPTDNMSES